MVKLMIFSWSHFMSVTMKSDLLLFGFDHAIRFDVIMTLVFFNNLRLKRGCLFKFENSSYKLSYSLKNTKCFGNLRLFTLSVAAFLC